MSINLPSLEGHTVGRYEVLEKKGEGDFGVTYRALDKSLGNAPVAIKFLKPGYDDPHWKDEALKAAKLRDVPQIVHVLAVDEADIQVNGQPVHLRYIVWEFVDGDQLTNIISRPGYLPSQFIIEVVRQLCLAVKAMQDAGLEHGDLHTGNILLIPPRPYEGRHQYRLKVVDFGLAKSFRGSSFKSDMQWVSAILGACWEKNKDYVDRVPLQDKRFDRGIGSIIKRLEDEVLERRLVDPIETMNHLQRVLDASKSDISAPIGQLAHPFEYLNAEEMPESSDLLYHLYSSNLPWLKTLAGFGTTVISGPRGCGKSMILKNLRLRTKLMSREYREKEFGEDNYVGFYVHCHNDIYLPFAGHIIDYSHPAIQQAFVHYINLLFAREALSTLDLMSNLKLVHIGDSAKTRVIDFITDNVLTRELSLIDDVDVVPYLCTVLERELITAQKDIVRKVPPVKCTSANFLKSLCLFLRSAFACFANKQFYFILDDYSKPRVCENIQKAFNRIVGVRNTVYCFKISAEKFSFVPTDFDLEAQGKEFMQDREFAYIDLGGKFLSYGKPKARKTFIETIINRRLERTQNVAYRDTVSLFGSYRMPSGNIANALIEHQSRRGGRRVPIYAGVDIMHSLCGGDIATFLSLCREIYDRALSEGEITASEVQPIRNQLQDKVVREFSSRRLERIKEILNHGDHIYHIVEVFGEVSRRYLYEYGRITRDKKRHYEVSRIEIRGGGILSKEAFEIFQTILLEGIFIDAGGRYPWGRGLLNNCFCLRPIYTPVLRITFRHRECLRLGAKRFESLLMRPDSFKKSGTAFLRGLLGQTEQGSLFDFSWEEGEEKRQGDENME